MHPSIDDLPLFAPGGYNVIVETPRGSRTKFAYDPQTGLFRAKKLLAMGFAFPFAFGFLPSTRGGDGDPLDVLLMTDAEMPTGTLVQCRLIGALTLEERTEGGETIRNDRLLAVPLLLHQDRPPFDLSDVPVRELEDIERFLIAYQIADGRQVSIGNRVCKEEAEALVREVGR